MIELQWRWSGWSGGPGYSTFHGSGTDEAAAQAFADDVDALFGTISNLVPTGLSIRSTGTYRLLSETTGALSSQGALPSPPPNHVGSGSAAFASSTGACIDWTTSVPVVSRVRVGRTYLVPLTAYAYAVDGTLADSVVTELQGAAASLLSAAFGVLAVWKRPSPGGSNGVLSNVTGYRIPDIPVVLRSRRR